MPRPLTWLPRLSEIRRSVANSVRSHYGRGDLEALFELQPRAAVKLLAMLPTLQVGTSRLVARETLAAFLDRVAETGDISALLGEMRREKTAVSRRQPRNLVRRDSRPASLASLPPTIGLSRGRLEVSFRTLGELAEALYTIARLLEDEGDAFAAAFEPVIPAVRIERPDEIAALFAELQALETQSRTRPWPSAAQASQGLGASPPPSS